MATGEAKRSQPFPCTVCKIDIRGNDSVECSGCGKWTHGDIKCSGLPKTVFKHLDNLSNLNYLCNTCKNNICPNTNSPIPSDEHSSSSIPKLPSITTSSHSDLAILFQTVTSLTESIKTIHEDLKLIKPLITTVHFLQNDVEDIKTALKTLNQNVPTSHTLNHLDIQKQIQDEVLESREREKRFNSIVVRGLGNDPNNIQPKFNQIINFLLPGKNITLHEVVPIRPNLIRAKVKDTSLRRDLLNVAKELRQSPFPTVFINRDLTYKQRQQLKLRKSNPPDPQTRTTTHQDPTPPPLASTGQTSTFPTPITVNLESLTTFPPIPSPSHVPPLVSPVTHITQ